MEIQLKTFEAQLQLAKETGKPIVIHSRDTEEQVLEILKMVIFCLVLQIFLIKFN